MVQVNNKEAARLDNVSDSESHQYSRAEESQKHFVQVSPKAVRITTWVCRICFAIVFVVNVQCALSYVFDPKSYVSGFDLSGVPGTAAVQGLGIAFLMWNVTYPAFIVNPRRYKALGVVVLIQQVIGLVGESVLYSRLPSGYPALSVSIERFISFDAFGLIIMAVSFTLFCIISYKANRLSA